MQMETFIREKYEKKRYITVENGGLGGQPPAASSRRSPYFPTGNALSSLHRDDPQSGGRYDDGATRRGTAMPLSYGDRFGPGASMNKAVRNVTNNAGRFNAGRMLGRPGNAFQRANTMKELLNMGFSTDLAARAVEASAGDLQKAVDWVLERNTLNNAPDPRPTTLSQHPVERDLLDFGTREAAPQSRVQSTIPAVARVAAAAPKSMATELLAPRSRVTASAPQAADSEDFADFGAFESALPATTSDAPSISGSTVKGPLSNSIASLYAQSNKVTTNAVPSLSLSPKSKAVPTTNVVSGVPRDRISSPDKKSFSPVSKAKPFLPTSPSAIPRFTWPTENNATAKRKVHAPPASSVASSANNAANMGNPLAATMPPPPPPMEEISIRNKDIIPPPPNSPPPSSPHPSKDEVSQPNAAPQTNGANNESKNETVNPPTENVESNGMSKKVEDAEEDPFAALSMFALSSAKSKKKQPPPKPIVTSPQLTEADSVPSEAPTAVPAGGGEFDLDALLG